MSQYFEQMSGLTNTIDFGVEIPTAQDAFLTIMKNDESQYFDFQRLRSPNADKMGKSKSPKKKGKESADAKDETIETTGKDVKDMSIW